MVTDSPIAAALDGYAGPGADHVKLGPLRYPEQGWEYPGGEAVAVLRRQPEWTDRTPFTVAVVADARAEDRRALAALRTTLFVASVDDGVGIPPVFTAVRNVDS